MPKAKNEKAERAKDLYHTGWKLVDIAKELGVPPGTVRRWKSTYGWDANVRKKTSVRNEAPAEEIEAVVDDPEIGEKWRLFILYYARSFNGVRSYQKAFPGSSYTTAAVESCRALKRPKIRDAIMELKRQRCAKAYLETEDIFQKYMDIAFADITDFVEFGQEEVPVMGAFGPVEVEDPETGGKVTLTKMVNTVRSRPSDEVDGSILAEVSQGKDGFKIKLADRMKALQWLTDHMDMATAEQRAKIENLRANTDRLQKDKQDDAAEGVQIIDDL